MKKSIIPAFLLTLSSLCSCSWGELRTESDPEPPTLTRGFIEIDVEQPFSGPEATDGIKSIRLIVFNLDSYPKVEVNTQESLDSEGASTLKAVLEVTLGEKLVVAIANEPEDMTATLTGIQNLSELEALELNMSNMFAANHLALKDGVMMPMSGAVWTKEEHIQPTVAEAKTHAQPLELYRMSARVDVRLITNIEGGVELRDRTTITLRNTYTQSPLVYHTDGDGNSLGSIQTVPAGGLIVHKWEAEPDYEQLVPEGGVESVFVCSFYTPERLYATGTDKLTVDILLDTPIGEKKATFEIDAMRYEGASDPTPINAVNRNNKYVITGEIMESPDVRTDIEVMEWHEGLEEFPIMQYYLLVDKPVVVFPAKGNEQTREQTVTVKSDYPVQWTITDEENLPEGVTVTGTTATTLTLKAEERSEPEEEAISGWFYIKAGNLNKRVRVEQAQAILRHNGNDLPPENGSPIPYGGGTYTVRAWTNLKDWRVRVYEGSDNTGRLLVSQRGSVDGSVVFTAEYGTSFIIPENDRPGSRTLAFYLFSEYEDHEVFICTRQQE